MPKTMLIDAYHREETRVAVLQGGKVEDFDFEYASRKPLRGNIYLARVTRVEPSLQAAFIEYGGNRHGFLAFGEIHPDYYQIPVADREVLRKAEALEVELAQKLSELNDDDDGADELDPDDDELRASADDHNDVSAEASSDETAEADGGEDLELSGAPVVVINDSADDGDESGENTEKRTVKSSDASEEEEEEAENVETRKTNAALDQTPGNSVSGDAEESSNAGEDNQADAPDTNVVKFYYPEGRDNSSSAGKDKRDDSTQKEIDALRSRYEEAKRDRNRLLRAYKIQEVIKRRQIMLVQVVKEERGNKGAALTTYMSLAGRYGVLMPNTARGGGISRKITSQSDRKRLKKAMKELDIAPNMGLIIRTAGAKRTKTEIKRDYDYLSRLWGIIRDKTLESVAPTLIYEEASLIKRAIRDLYDKDMETVIVHGDDGYREAKDFMKMLMPSHSKFVKQHKDDVPLFLKHKVEEQLDKMFEPVVQLKSGGYLVIQQTEALVSIDVNSGKATKERNVEQTALKTNSEAAAEVARQCRLRDLAGLIVIDFIDMEENRNNRTVEKKLKEAMKNDRARIQIGSISSFGLLEMSRQRRRSGIVDGTTQTCPVCQGAGHVRSHEMAALRILRAAEGMAVLGKHGLVTIKTSTEVALYILNTKRAWLERMERSYGVKANVLADSSKFGDQYDISASGSPSDTMALKEAIGEEGPLSDLDAPELEESSAKDDDDKQEASSGDDDDRPKRKRRRRRRGRSKSDENGAQDESKEQDASSDDSRSSEASEGDASSNTSDDQSEDDEESAGESDASTDDADGEPKRRRRRGRRGGRRNRRREDESADTDDNEQPVAAAADASPSVSSKEDSEKPNAHAAADNAPSPGPSSSKEDSGAAQSQLDDHGQQETRSAKSDGGSAPHTEPSASPSPARETASSNTNEAASQQNQDDADDKPRRGGWWQRALGKS